MLDYPLSIFLDTNIFKSCKYHIKGNSVLGYLKRFEEQGKVKIYLSKIVLSEVLSHIEKDAIEAYNKFKSAKREAVRCISPTLIENTDLINHFNLPPEEEVVNAAVHNFKRFLSELNIIELDNKGIDVDLILKDYFEFNPPFEDKKEKKHEFPDAFMIAKLKDKFSDQDPVYIITSDKGFKSAFAEEKDFICFDTLNDLFDLINSQEEVYNKITEFLIDNKVKGDISEKIRYQIEVDDIFIDGRDCDRKGYCEGFDYSMTEIENVSDVEYEIESINEIDDEEVNVSLLCKVEVEAFCYYTDYENSPWDSEEKEYIFTKEILVEEIHKVEFIADLSLSIYDLKREFNYDINNISYDFILDEETREERYFTTEEDLEQDARSDMTEALAGHYD